MCLVEPIGGGKVYQDGSFQRVGSAVTDNDGRVREWEGDSRSGEDEEGLDATGRSFLPVVVHPILFVLITSIRIENEKEKNSERTREREKRYDRKWNHMFE